MRSGFNYDWSFVRDDDISYSDINCNMRKWEKVSTPHTPKVEKLNVYKPYAGKMWYRKEFNIEKTWKGERLTIEFEGVMIACTIYVNGVLIKENEGGYLPFEADITGVANYGGKNIIAIMVDNRDNRDIPPGNPNNNIDFLYFGGIYRNVWLNCKPSVHITNPITSNTVAGGGVFISTTSCDGTQAVLNIKVEIENMDEYSHNISVECLCSLNNNHYNGKSQGLEQGKGMASYQFSVNIDDVQVWSPEYPNLYDVVVTVLSDGREVDKYCLKYGIRTLAATSEGLVLNGKVYRLRGANRHHQFPYIGIKGSENADYRDAYKLKEAGFNSVRLSHYPHSEAFLRACDEIGLLAINCLPGWQYFRAGKFERLCFDNIRNMVRRDRNHSCVALWECSLNETGTHNGASDDFYIALKEAAMSEYPYPNFLTCGDTHGRDNPTRIDYDVPFTMWEETTASRPLGIEGKKGLTREYGDCEFGGHGSTTRVDRQDGEMAMLIQAFNFQWEHCRNINNVEDLGDLIWEGIDHNRGYIRTFPISKSGVLDVFRLPKFSYYFYKSQKRDKPMVFIASLWTNPKIRTVTIFSNCESIKLYRNGEFVREQTPDIGEAEGYYSEDSRPTVDYWLKGGDMVVPSRYENNLAKHTKRQMFKGGSSNGLASPPFTFKGVDYIFGELRAEGIIGGKVVATHSIRTPLQAERIILEQDISGKTLTKDGRDFVFVYAKIIDSNGTVCHKIKSKAVFTVNNGVIFGNGKPKFVAGIATILVASNLNGEKDIITVSVKGKGLKASLTI